MLSSQAFGKMFETFTTAFRLEALPAYSIPEEAEALARFAQGAAMPDPPPHQPWLDFVAQCKADDRLITRIRLISSPLTLYERAEVSWSFPMNAAVGEDIRLLDRDSAPAGAGIYQDFWIFDDATVVGLVYDAQGAFIGANQVTDATEIAAYRVQRDTALAIATPLAAFNGKSTKGRDVPEL